jgi:hypothetical protein
MTPTLSQQDINAIAQRIADLSDGSGTQRCVSLAEGALGADLRVNYELGMVLGVDEFRQEQHYFLQKEYLHNRALHGYGTVYGLRVTLARPPGDPNDVQISVEPGMAIDQWGRVVMVRETQCARLGAWLAKNPAPDVGPSGEQRVYAALRYDECPDVLQPIAGQPCSGSAAQMAPARIRDGFHLELRWDEPRMPAYLAVQRFARMLAAVRVEPGLPAGSSDEATIITVLRALNGEGESVFDQGGPGVAGLPLDPPRDTLRLPAEGLREALDRIFAVWATEVRPKLPPDLSDPAAASGGDPAGAGILLAAIDFLAEPPYIADELLEDSADNGLRPVLLHTGLIQQLLLLGGRASAEPLRAVRQLVTVRAVLDDNRRTSLTLWFHPNADGLVHLPTGQGEQPALTIFSVERGRELRFTLRPIDPEQRDGRDFAGLWRVELLDENDLADGERLVLTFLTARVLTAPSGLSLAELSEQQRLAFVGFSDNDRVRVFHQVRLPAVGGGEIDPEQIREIVREQLLRRPNLPFVTLTPLPFDGQGLRPVELWFHLDFDPFTRDVLLGYSEQGRLFIAQLSVLVFAEVGGPRQLAGNVPNPPVPDPNSPPELIEIAQEGPVQLLAYNRSQLLLNQSQLRELGNPPLRFVFLVDDFILGRGEERFPLRDYFEQAGRVPISFSGYNGEKTIVAFLRLAEEVG